MELTLHSQESSVILLFCITAVEQKMKITQLPTLDLPSIGVIFLHICRKKEVRQASSAGVVVFSVHRRLHNTGVWWNL